MAEVNSLRMHLIEELADLLDAEQQVTKALPKMATMATGRRQALGRSLKEEEAADGKLTSIAESTVNEDAAEEWQAQESEGGILGRSARWLGFTVGSARRRLAGGSRGPAFSTGIVHEHSSAPRIRRRRPATRRTSRCRSRRSRR